MDAADDEISPIVEQRQPTTSSSSYHSEITVLYVTERILVLTFQAASKRTDDSVTASEENAYRSSLRHVCRMLRTKHGDSYKIFNLSRRRRDLCQYNNYVVEFGWPVNQAPPLERLCALCKDIDGWLNRDAQNIAILHEKPGASRAAMVVAVFMHYCSISASDDQALDRFAMRKFYNEQKVQPSQKRYVNYFSSLLSGQIKINSSPIYLYQIVIYGLPVGSRPYLKFYEKMVPVLTTGAYKIQNPVLTARLHPPLALRGDVLVKCCETAAAASAVAEVSSTSSEWQQRRPILLFACQFNTCAIDPRKAPCFSFSARELDLTSNEEAGLDLIYSFDKDFRPVGELATIVDEDTTATLALRSNSYDRFDRFPEEDSPSAPQTDEQPVWTGHSPLPNGSAGLASPPQQQHQQKANYRSPQQQRAALLVRQSSANATADSGIRSVMDGDSSGGSRPVNVENVVVESQAKRAELVDQRALTKGTRNQKMANTSDFNIAETERIMETTANATRVLDRATEKKTPNGPVSAVVTSPSMEYTNRMAAPAPKDVGGVGQIEFPHRPPPLTAPGRRPFSPHSQQMLVSPGSLATTGANLTQDGKEIDAELVEEGRYDPQSRAFSYVPAKSLEDHFKSPRQQTKLVLKTERSQGAELTGPPPAPLPLTDNDLADLDKAAQFEPSIEKRGRQQQQQAGPTPAPAPSSTPGTETPQRKRSTSRSRTPLTTEEFDQLLNPDFYLTFQGEQPQPVSSLPATINRMQQDSPSVSLTTPATIGRIQQQSPSVSLAQPLLTASIDRMQYQPAPSRPHDRGRPEDSTAFDDLVAYGMKGTNSEAGAKLAKEMEALKQQQQQKSVSTASRVPPHLDTRRGWTPPKRVPGVYKDDDIRWDEVFDDFEKKFIKYPEQKSARPDATPPSSGYSSSFNSQRPWTTAPPTPVLPSRQQHQRAPYKPYELQLGESMMRALGTDNADDSWAVSPARTAAESLPARPSTAMGFQSNYEDQEDDSMVRRATPSRYLYSGLGSGSAGDTGRSRSDLGPMARPRTQSGGSDVDWLSRQMEKLRLRKESNDPGLRKRREQERQLLHELRHVHEDQLVDRTRSEAGYSIEGVGTRPVMEPSSERDQWQKQQQHHHQNIPPHLLFRPRTEQHTPPTQQQQAEHTTEPGTILLRRELITNPSESALLNQQQLPSARPKTPSSYQGKPYEQQPSGGHGRPEKPFDFHRLQEVLWDNRSTPQQQTPTHQGSSVSSRTVSSPRSILKKPKHSPVEAQHYSSISAPSSRPYSQRPSSPYSINGYHDIMDSPASRGYEIETASSTAEPAFMAPQSYRSETPAFPLRGETPLPYHPYLYSGADREPRTPPIVRAHSASFHGVRPPSPGSAYYGQSRRSSLTSLLETMDVVHHHPVFVKDTSKYWYKPHISREEAIAILKDKPPGTFIIRDSNSFPGAFGLAVKVSTPPPGVQTKTNDGSELVRHFLIEPTAKGVKLKGCNNEPIFGSLAALVYQHSITPLALPIKLLLPEYDLAATSDQIGSAQALLEQGAACNVTYLQSYDTESLTGPEAVRRAVDQALFAAQQKQLTPVSAHFKVSNQGITITDNTRKLFFRRHYPVNSVTFCGLDPEERRWTVPGSAPVRIFGFVARKIANRTENACHIFAELEPEQPATAIVNFITKVMMAPVQRHQSQRHLD